MSSSPVWEAAQSSRNGHATMCRWALRPLFRRSVKAAPRILVPIVQVRILAAEQLLRGGAEIAVPGSDIPGGHQLSLNKRLSRRPPTLGVVKHVGVDTPSQHRGHSARPLLAAAAP